MENYDSYKLYAHNKTASAFFLLGRCRFAWAIQVDEEQLELAIGTVRRTERNTFIPMITETEAGVKSKIR